MTSAANPLPTVTVDPDEARDVADRVLSGRAYLEAAKPPSLRERFFDWLGGLFTDLLGALQTVGGRGLMAVLMLGIFTIVVLIMLWLLVRALGGYRPGRRESSPDVLVDVVSNLSAEQWLQAARDAEGTGDWRNGLRCRHRALTTELIDLRLVTARPGQTAGEINDELARNVPGARPAMQEATWLFKDAWYGWSTPGPTERDRFHTLADQVIAEASRTSAPTGASGGAHQTVDAGAGA